MTQAVERVVFDCNVLLQAVVNPSGPAGRCVALWLQGEFTLCVSDLVVAEARDVMTRPVIVAQLKFLPERASELLDLVERVADRIADIPEIWTYDRDPDDAHYVNLAIAARAKLIVTRDNDLLDLMNPNSTEGAVFLARFSELRILTPPAFLAYLLRA